MLSRIFSRMFRSGNSNTMDRSLSSTENVPWWNEPIIKEREARPVRIDTISRSIEQEHPAKDTERHVVESPLGSVSLSALTDNERTMLDRLLGTSYVDGVTEITEKQQEVLSKVASFEWSPQAVDYWKTAFLVASKATPENHVSDNRIDTPLPNVGRQTESLARNIRRPNESASVRTSRAPSMRNTQANMRSAYADQENGNHATATPDYLLEHGEALNEEQQHVFDFIERTSRNLFITGRAGSGKSFLLKYLLGNSHKKILPIAFMGVAALNIGGSTIHSTFGLPTTFIDPKEARKLGRNLSFNQAQILRKIDTIVVDEISMVSGDMFQAIDAILRVVRETDEPFGGVQLLLFGDPYQLPPIVSEEDIAEFYADNWGSEWFFSTPAWQAGDFLKLELQTPMRQSDPEFLSILDSLRIGEISFSEQEVLNDRITSEREIPVEGAMRIAGTGVQADSYNNQRLTELPGKPRVYRGSIKGNYERNTKRLPAPLILSLKPGAQVLMVKNDTQSRWVNGSLGTVVEVEPHSVVVSINSFEYEVDVVAWKKYRHKYNRYEKSMSVETIAEYKQYPVDLGWARTIHKSQGQTFEKCVVDLNRGLFEKGQAYVAMSRCRSLDGLFLTAPLEFSSILSSDLVHEFMSDLRPAMSLPSY